MLIASSAALVFHSALLPPPRIPLGLVPHRDSQSHRRDAITDATSVVVKVGTRVLTNSSGKLDLHRIEALAQGLCEIAESGRQTIIVSSGAVGAGMGKLGLTERPTGLSRLQAVAAVGQTDLIQAYELAFARCGRHAAQVLLTRSDLKRRDAYLHVRNTLARLHDYGAITVVNENDSVAVSELRTTFGDNDRLASQVAGLLENALLVILSDIEGLFDGPPDQPESQKIDLVETLDSEVLGLASDQQNSVSKGGMGSKLSAAQLATSHGQHVIIGPGKEDQVLQKILRAETIGTLFLPQPNEIRGRRRWIGGSADPEGRLLVDAGAAKALQDNGSSLLAIGIRKVVGDFDAGAVVSVVDPSGIELARGLCNYKSKDAKLICGKANEAIAKTLGKCPYDSVVHRDNMTLTP